MKKIWKMMAMAFLLALLPGSAASAAEGGEIRISEDGSVAIESEAAAAEGVSSLQFSLQVEAEGAADVRFQFDGSKAKLSEFRYDRESGKLNIYVAGTEALFAKGSPALTVGRVKATDRSGRAVPANVSVVDGSLKYVSGTAAKPMEGVELPGAVRVEGAGASSGGGSSNGGAAEGGASNGGQAGDGATAGGAPGDVPSIGGGQAGNGASTGGQAGGGSSAGGGQAGNSAPSGVGGGNDAQSAEGQGGAGDVAAPEPDDAEGGAKEEGSNLAGNRGQDTGNVETIAEAGQDLNWILILGAAVAVVAAVMVAVAAAIYNRGKHPRP